VLGGRGRGAGSEGRGGRVVALVLEVGELLLRGELLLLLLVPRLR
jgi:hypothetical protein